MRSVSVDFIRRTSSLWLKLDSLCPRGVGLLSLWEGPRGGATAEAACQSKVLPLTLLVEKRRKWPPRPTRSFNLECILLSDEDVCTWWWWFSCQVVRLFATLWTVARQAPPSVGCSRQECWSGLPFPSPGHLCNPGIEPVSPTLAGGFFSV